MGTKVADIYADVGFKFDSVKLRDVAKYVGDINISSIIATTSLVGLGIGIKGLVDESAALSNNLNILSTTTGVDPQFIQKLEHAAYVLGSSKQAADQWISSLSGLQQKLMVAQGDQRFFTAAQMLGVDPVSFQKIIGTTEGLSQAVIKILSSTNNATDKIQYEKIQRTKTWLASLINVPPDLLTAFQNPHFGKEFNSFQGISNADIKQNIESTRQWREVVDEVNTAFLNMVQTTLPELTSAVKGFVQDGGLKDTLELIKDAGETLYKIDLLTGIGGNYVRTAFLNARSNEQSADTEYKKDLQRQGSTSITVKVDPITIKTDSPHEFGKKFQDEFTKALEIATRQSTLGQV